MDKSQAETVKKTFMEGGYYRLDYNENLVFLSINSLMFSVKNEKMD